MSEEKQSFIDQLYEFIKKGIKEESNSDVTGAVVFTIEKTESGKEVVRVSYAGCSSVGHRLNMMHLLTYQIVAHNAALYDKFLIPLDKEEFEKVWKEVEENANTLYSEFLKE